VKILDDDDERAKEIIEDVDVDESGTQV